MVVQHVLDDRVRGAHLASTCRNLGMLHVDLDFSLRPRLGLVGIRIVPVYIDVG